MTPFFVRRLGIVTVLRIQVNGTLLRPLFIHAKLPKMQVILLALLSVRTNIRPTLNSQLTRRNTKWNSDTLLENNHLLTFTPSICQS